MDNINIIYCGLVHCLDYCLLPAVCFGWVMDLLIYPRRVVIAAVLFLYVSGRNDPDFVAVNTKIIMFNFADLFLEEQVQVKLKYIYIKVKKKIYI